MIEQTKRLVDAHIADLHREAQRSAARAAARRAHTQRHRPDEEPITIRLATPEDEAHLSSLAALDSSPVPAAPVLIAETRGGLRAAISLSDRATIADPFQPSAAIIELLVIWASHGAQPLGRRFPRRRGRLSWRHTAGHGEVPPDPVLT